MENKVLPKKRRFAMAVPYFFLWIFYTIITSEERMEYAVSREKGMMCVGSKDSSTFLPGAKRTFCFDPQEKPKRNFLTWKEFWKTKGFVN